LSPFCPLAGGQTVALGSSLLPYPMAAVSFLLKEPNATKPTPIFAFLSFDGKRVKVYSGLSILPKQWVKANQRA
jgi:hypothetical protein